ncbi:MAG: hypothetical protein CVV44_16045 [Spirochaetae bacterium HGW-Spirochaetae-1]|nr:MAG: hypothetical protein CVV44_16045 [Spirochaetae bacterium HGW-Spirochaetae-1]
MIKIYTLFLTSALVVSTACSRTDMWNKFDSQNTDPPSPISVIISPAGGAWLSSQAGIINNEATFLFDTSMDTASLTLTGTMASTSAIAWSTTNVADDTLTITPSASRTIENGATLTIDCDSLEGANIIRTRTYNITGSVYYVNISAPGPLTGTRLEPMNDIQAAVTAAKATAAAISASTPGVVLVAAGTYNTSNTLVIMAEGISLYGGYSATSWDLRNPATYVTILKDQRTSLGVTTPLLNAARIIEVPAGITGMTIIDGFTLNVAPIFTGASILSACAIFINNASPEISNNTITSSDVSSTNNPGVPVNTVGICHINGGSPSIHDNSIALATRGDTYNTCTNYGIYLATNADSHIHDNSMIYGGASTGTAGIVYGIFISNSSPIIENNRIIVSGATNNSFAIHIFNAAPDIHNNYIYGGSSGSETTGIRVDGSSGIVSCYNNIIDAGAGANNRYGINIIDGDINIFNNIINGGTGDKASGIYITNSSVRTVQIENNNIFTNDGDAFNAITSYGVYATSATSYPTTLNNNNFFYCDIQYYNYIDGVADKTVTLFDISTVLLIDAGDTVPAKNNISEDIYADLDQANEYRYIGDYNAVGVVFDTSGIDGNGAGWGYTIDRDGNTRTETNGWSIGAYEYD